MSFDQLPDDLIALVASNCYAVDIPNLLQTQKRILNVLRGHGLDKPKFEEIEIDIKRIKSGFELTMQGHRTDGRTFKKVIQTKESLDWEIVTSFLEKCRSSEKVKITGKSGSVPLDARSAEGFSKIARKICKFYIASVNLTLSPDQFSNFCGMFASTSLNQVTLLEKVVCDDVFTKIVKTTKMMEFFPHFVLGASPDRLLGQQSKIDVSDVTLEALTTNCKCYHFSFEARPNFTIDQIRKIVENAVRNNQPFYMKFGALPLDQRENAENWLANHPNRPRLPYRIQGEYLMFKIFHKSSLAAFSIDLPMK